MGSELGNEKLEVGRKIVRTYKDLDVYQRSLEAAKTVLTCVVPRLPAVEKFDLALISHGEEHDNNGTRDIHHARESSIIHLEQSVSCSRRVSH